MKNVKSKVSAKIASAKAKIATKTAKAKTKAKPAALVLCCGVLAAVLSGCATADAPTAQRAQTIVARDNAVTINIVCATNATAAATPAIHFEFATAAQANETSGTETMSATATQTPTNHVPTDLKLTYGLASDSATGTDWISQLTSASAKGLASWLKSSSADGTMTVTKTDGTTETVTCKDGTCTTSSGDCITCTDGSASSD